MTRIRRTAPGRGSARAGRCAVSGLALPELLVASHIIPWADSVERRADPRNGLCLNALFDPAFGSTRLSSSQAEARFD